MASFDKNELQVVANNVWDDEKRIYANNRGKVRLEGWYIRVPDKIGEFYPDGREMVPIMVVQLSYPGSDSFMGRTYYARDVPVTQLAKWKDRYVLGVIR